MAVAEPVAYMLVGAERFCHCHTLGLLPQMSASV